jgi:triosephosphate isomerase
VGVAIQNIHTAKGLGAYTGHHTAEVVKDFGLKWVLTGHSEMRSLFGESDEATAQKTRAAIDIGATAVVCIGESLTEREAGTTMAVCIRQLTAVKAVLAEADWAHVVVAYEPVWAIGTGKVATKEQAQEVHKDLRAWLATSVSPAVAEATRIVYGGSVNVSKGTLFPPPFLGVRLPFKPKAYKPNFHCLQLKNTHTQHMQTRTGRQLRESDLRGRH